MPGKSGNPKGRTPKREDLRARCVKAVDEVVVDAWVRELGTAEKKYEDRGPEWVECSKLLAAYGYGKPTQPIHPVDAEGETLQVQVVVLPPEGT